MPSVMGDSIWEIPWHSRNMPTPGNWAPWWVLPGTINPLRTYTLHRLISCPKRLRDESCGGLVPPFGDVWYALGCTWLWCSFRNEHHNHVYVQPRAYAMKRPVYKIYIDWLLNVNIPNKRQLSIPSCRFSIVSLCREQGVEKHEMARN